MQRWERWCAGMVLILACLPGHASPASESQINACIDQAAGAFGVPSLPVHVLRKVEAGQVGMTSANKDGSYDIGPMQINSSWLESLKPLGINEIELRDNGCVNAYVGTWIFYQTWLESNRDPVMAMARYHSHTPRRQAEYLNLVLKVLDREVNRAIANR